MEESSTACLSFKLRSSATSAKDFRSFKFVLLFDNQLNGNPKTYSVTYKTIWGPQMLGAPAI